MVGRLAFAASCWLALAACGRVGFGGESDRGIGVDSGGPGGDGALVADSMVPVAGLVAQWGFDEGTGQIVNASPGMSGVLGTSAAVDASDPQWETTASRICTGSGLTFDGVDDIVTISGPSTPDLTQFTITFSMYATGAGGGQLPRILTKEDGGVADTIVHFRSIDNAIAINMFDTSGTLYATFGGAVVLDQRANWAVAYDDAGDRRVHIYQNGVEGSYLRQDTMTGTLRATDQAWEIGDQATLVRAFDGTLDEVRVYDRVLAPAEIAALSAMCPP